MWQYIAKRALHLIPILFGVSLLTFMLMWMTPGNFFDHLKQNPQISPEKIAELEAKWQLDKPFYVAYFYWLKNAAQGDLGYSMAYKMDASELISSRLWNTFLLSFFATALAWLVAILLAPHADCRRHGKRRSLLIQIQCSGAAPTGQSMRPGDCPALCVFPQGTGFVPSPTAATTRRRPRAGRLARRWLRPNAGGRIAVGAGALGMSAPDAPLTRRARIPAAPAPAAAGDRRRYW